MTKPVWFLDVDGVINAFPHASDRKKYLSGKATPFFTDGCIGYKPPLFPIRYDPSIISRMVELHEAGVVEIVWLTTWGAGANGSLRRLLRMLELRVAGEMDDPELRGPGWWKTKAVQSYAAKHPNTTGFVWTDDDIRKAHTLADAASIVDRPLLPICTDGRTGLTHEEMDRIEQFLTDGNPLIRDCACGRDHDTMPMIDVSSCACAWSHDPDSDCNHAEYLTPGVCLKHKRHIPCRPCMH